MSEFTEHEREAIRRLLARAEGDPTFTQDDLVLIREVIKAAETLTALGRGAKWVVWGLASVGGAVAAWSQIKEALIRWLSG